VFPSLRSPLRQQFGQDSWKVPIIGWEAVAVKAALLAVGRGLAILHVPKHRDSSLFRLKQLDPKGWNSLVTEVGGVVREQPLWKLQTVGDEPTIPRSTP
jgi:hypothetical protein